VVFGFTLLFVLGALASGALGQVTEGIGTPTDTTATDTTAPSTTDTTPTDPVPTDTTATATSPAASQYGTTSTDSTTTTTTPTGPPVPYIVTFKDGVSDATQQADISAAGGTPGDAISVLSMYSVTFRSGEDATDAAALLANADVAAVDQDSDKAGNEESNETATVRIDTVGPVSSASGPNQVTNAQPFTVAYTASDASPSSGLLKVELWGAGAGRLLCAG
jgi:hypothetical protein